MCLSVNTRGPLAYVLLGGFLSVEVCGSSKVYAAKPTNHPPSLDVDNVVCCFVHSGGISSLPIHSRQQ